MPDTPITTRTPAELGVVIRELRKKRGWTQTDLATWLHVTRFTVASLEHGGPVSLPLAFEALAVLGSALAVVPRDRRIVFATEAS